MTLLHLQLFWGESQQTFLGLDGLPDLSRRQQNELQQWCNKRRKILKFEAHSQPWVKINSKGESTELQLKANGAAFEKNLFGDTMAEGRWHIDEGVLFVLLMNDERTVEYRVIGSSDNNIHTGAEYVDGRPSNLIKLVQVKPH
jgi:hypothetical protein